MEPGLISAIVILIFFVLLISGVPIFGALGIASVIGIFLFQGPRGLGALSGVINDRLTNFTLVAVPLFVLMGQIIFHTGIGADIYTAAYRCLNKLSGSLGMASVAACAVFGALCGVSLAGAATIGAFAVPEMLKRGYDKGLATGCIAGAGGLSLLIPPSVALILYGVIAEESVGKLFVAGIIPGIVLAILMMSYIWILAKVVPHMAPQPTETISWGMRIRALAKVWPALVLIFLVLGTIYLGIATPTESAAIGCMGAIALGFQRKTLTGKTLKKVFRETVLTNAMIGLIVASALLFSYILTLLQLPQHLTEFVVQSNFPNWVILLLIFALIYLMGMFIDVASVILISTPIVLPIVLSMGYSPIWFGIVLAIACEIGTETPPVGLNIFAIKSVSPPNIELMDIIKGAFPFVIVETIGLIIFVAFPSLTFLLL